MSAFHDSALVGASGQQGYQISRSLRFNSADSAYLNRTPASAGNRRTWTWSGWVKTLAPSSSNIQLFSTPFVSSGTNSTYFTFSNGTLALVSVTAGVNSIVLVSSAVYRDPSAWFHVVAAVDTTDATASNRAKLYVNGVQITAFSTATYPSQNADTYVNNNVSHLIGAISVDGTPSQFFGGYLTEINFIDGQALTPSSFGETDTITGVWKPKKYAGTYGTNGFYLNFSDNSGTTSTTLGKDSSGNSNNWTPNNFSVTAGAGNDSLIDTPTPYADGGNGRGNYCTLNPLDTGGTAPVNGNLELTAGAAERGVRSTFAIPTSGLFYAEALVGTNQSGATDIAFGLVSRTTSLTANPYNISNGWLIYGSSTTYITRNGSSTLAGAGTALVSGDVLQIAVDLTNNKGWIGKNNTWFNSSTGTDGNPATGANATFTFSSPPELFILAHCYSSTINANFGQRPFAYTPPSGFVALNTQNLPEPSIKKPSLWMDVSLWSGTSASQTIVNSGFQPDLVWTKNRNGANPNLLNDSVRGITTYLQSNATNAEATDATSFTSFNSNGFTLGANTGGGWNTSGLTYVGWQWKESATPGFDIVTYTGTGSATTVAHSLGVAPSMIVVKKRNGVSDWPVYHTSIGGTGALRLDLTNATDTTSAYWNNTAPTSSVFSVGTANDTNASSGTYVAYLWSEVAGFSKFGSYTGNNSTDGPFVYTGFRIRWLMIKRYSLSGSSWIIYDAVRNTSNVINYLLQPNAADADFTSSDIDFAANGFKLRNTSSYVNASADFIYAAFAETPQKYSLAR